MKARFGMAQAKPLVYMVAKAALKIGEKSAKFNIVAINGLK
jgi:hypothetical protein